MSKVHNLTNQIDINPMENTGTNTNDAAETYKEFIDNEWMIRPCEIYTEEYKDCRSIKSRFQQYFVFGKTTDCTQWKRDADNCYKWNEYKDIDAAKQLIDSEQKRRLERLKGHYGNNVWKKRKLPPDDWNKPLPENLQKEYEHTYLNIKSMEMKGEIPPQIDFQVPSISPCVIL